MLVKLEAAQCGSFLCSPGWCKNCHLETLLTMRVDLFWMLCSTGCCCLCVPVSHTPRGFWSGYLWLWLAGFSTLFR